MKANADVSFTYLHSPEPILVFCFFFNHQHKQIFKTLQTKMVTPSIGFVRGNNMSFYFLVKGNNMYKHVI